MADQAISPKSLPSGHKDEPTFLQILLIPVCYFRILALFNSVPPPSITEQPEMP